MESQSSIDSEDQLECPALRLEGPVQLYDFAEKVSFFYMMLFPNLGFGRKSRKENTEAQNTLF